MTKKVAKNGMFTPGTSMETRLVTFWRWIGRGSCRIKNRTGQLVPLRPNNMQKRMFQRLLDLAATGQPIRIIILKARKHGCSTFWQALFFFLAQYTPQCSGRTIAHTIDATHDIFAISKRIARNLQEGPVPEVARAGACVWKHDSDLTLRTAGGEHVSSGATIDLLHLSELAKWPGGTPEVQAQLASVMQSVPKTRTSIIIVESTANMLDVSGQFRTMWAAAKLPESGMTPLFSPWFEDEDYRLKGKQVENLDAYEQSLVDRFQLTHEQLAWRRRVIATEFSGDERYFRQEFPATEEEAFQAPTGLIYPMLTRQVHGTQRPVEELVAAGGQLFRGIDFGGSDPFVCLWAAHFPGRPGFSVDIEACPHTWEELTHYAWGPHGRPRDEADHTADVVRYITQYFNVTGHLHVYRELYEKDFASTRRSVLDLGQLIKSMTSPIELVQGTVADRSRPDTIQLLNLQGLPVVPNSVPGSNSERGEKVDGIMRLQAMMVATIPLVYPPPKPLWQDDYRRRQRTTPLWAGIDSHEMIVALSAYEQDQVDDPLFGSYV